MQALEYLTGSCKAGLVVFVRNIQCWITGSETIRSNSEDLFQAVPQFGFFGPVMLESG
jgi:hypothetical protein